MVEWVLEGANKVNRMQTLILALEGCVLCVLAFGYMWQLSMQVGCSPWHPCDVSVVHVPFLFCIPECSAPLLSMCSCLPCLFSPSGGFAQVHHIQRLPGGTIRWARMHV
jgi:hypothetical protein